MACQWNLSVISGQNLSSQGAGRGMARGICWSMVRGIRKCIHDLRMSVERTSNVYLTVVIL